METSKDTHTKLQSDLKRKNKELEKLQNMEKKIDTDLKSLETSVATMRGAIKEYKDIEGLKETAKQSCERYRALHQEYLERKEQSRLLLDSERKRLDKVRRAIKDHPENRELKRREERIAQQEQEVFRLKESANSFEKDCDYENIKRECMKTVAKINEKVQWNMETKSRDR